LSDLRRIRHRVFSTSWPLDEQLAAIASGTPSHQFLQNPASQLPFIYLTQYVKAAAEAHLGRPFGQISVLDWGCGKGQVTKLMRDLRPGTIESCDVELDKDDSSFGQATPLLKHFEIPVTPLRHPYQLPYPDASFDVLLSFGVLEHVPDDMASLAEIHRVLTPGGLFFCFYLPTSLSWTQKLAHMRGNDYHDRLYSRRKVENMLSSTGFNLLDLWYRPLLPKNTVQYPAFRTFERLDQWFTRHTPLRLFATNIEFASAKPR
jgi:SAM-dependent methyltransferase